MYVLILFFDIVIKILVCETILDNIVFYIFNILCQTIPVKMKDNLLRG